MLAVGGLRRVGKGGCGVGGVGVRSAFSRRWMSHDHQKYRWEHYGKGKHDKQESKSELKHRNEPDTVMELTVTPVGSTESSLATYVALSARICKNHELRHEVHPMGTVVEGSVDDCLAVIREVLEKSLTKVDRVVMNARLDVRPGELHRLDKKHKKLQEITNLTGEEKGEE
eukprot:TRINITY_DN9014_c0_g1_i1.p1 TRINITY_DN9014_c0_g1~~TRINITY_DN9014_c0_g1_i1.p1  ORF type:complete len:171 (-),score=31.38 TRINITY_DN9014_c0_g1_i1:49-561(-)